MTNKIAVLIGSLRKESFNKKIVMALKKLAPVSLDLEIIDIGNLPLYNQDADDNPPQAWVKFREHIKKFDGVLFATPEYNRSMPAVIKNAIDIGSRPYGQSIWDGKPTAVISASPGAIGGFGANHHLRQSLVFLNMPCLQQPEIYLGNVAAIFDDQGNITNEKTLEILGNFIKKFAAWVEKHV